MKLRTLAIAVAAATLSMSAAQAEMDISGDVTLGWASNQTATDSNGNAVIDKTNTFGDFGSELTVKGSHKSGGLTYFSGFELDAGTSKSNLGAASLNIEEIHAGVKGAFGQVVFGETDNACDKMTVGGDWNEFVGVGDRGECSIATDKGTIRYSRALGRGEVAASHNIDTSETSFAGKMKFGAATEVSLGYAQNSELTDSESVGVAVTSKMGPIQVKARGNDDDQWSLHGAYATGANTFHVGTDDTDDISIGYIRQLAPKTTFHIEVLDDAGTAGVGGDTEYGIGFIQSF